MKRLSLIFIILMLLPVAIWAFTNYESITVTNTAIGFTPAKILPSLTAYCSLETAQIRFRMDGTNPTSSEGHLMNPGDTIVIDGYSSIQKFMAIRTGSTSGVLKCSYR